MREILFRAKTLKDVHWVYGDLMKSGTDPADGEYDIMYWDDESGWMQEHVDPKTIGQFTGYVDSMNFRIYEGDIVNVAITEYDTTGRLYGVTDMPPYLRGVVAYNERQCKFEILLEENTQGRDHHIISCEIGWGHESFLVVGKYIETPFPLERDRKR